MTSRVILNAINQNQANMKRATILAKQEVLSLFRVSKDETDLNTIKLIRDTFPSITERYGSVSSQAAAVHYDELRDIAFQDRRVPTYAAATPALAYSERIETVLDYGIASNFTDNRQKMATVLSNGITGIVSQYNRDTISANSERDNQIGLITVQRVAEPNACSFCAMLAVNDITFTGIEADAAIITYEDEYHENCNCSVETVFEGQDPIKPPYYNKMEETYKEAERRIISEGQEIAESQGYSGRGNAVFQKNNPEYSFVAKNITRYMREIGGLK